MQENEQRKYLMGRIAERLEAAGIRELRMVLRFLEEVA